MTEAHSISRANEKWSERRMVEMCSAASKRKARAKLKIEAQNLGAKF